MDQQLKSRPKRVAATKPKNYAVFHPTRKSPITAHAKSPPISNGQVTSPHPRSPAVAATPAPMEQRADDNDVLYAGPEIEDNMAATSESDEHPIVHVDSAESNPPLTSYNLEEFFASSTKRFERMINSAVERFIAKLNELEGNISASLDFERERIDKLQEKQAKMEKKMEEMEKEMNELKAQAAKNAIATNKSERFSRRNNIRLVGVKEVPQGQREECVDIVEEILREKFDMHCKVERAHRDGRRVEGRPRHILFKFLSYRQKVDVMKRAREALKNDPYFFVDDLTPLDLQEKQKYVKRVQELYRDGTKLRFYAGKWRNAGGAAYNFD